MKPGDYYYGRFRDDFRTFWRSLELKGSCSRARKYEPDASFQVVVGSHLARALDPEGGHFSIGDLFIDRTHNLPDHLAEVPRERLIDFLSALFYTVLIDQAMYTHRRDDYKSFRALTLYPKMDETVGWARTLMMANPYEIFDPEVLEPRDLRASDVRLRFKEWAQFIVDDLYQFFDERSIGTTKWTDIRGAMLADPDCTRGEHGLLLRRCLLNAL